ncbi:hypothetical protein [Robertkochia aurantiaca]|uniref:hypothetical protein n=1 Tax=Robertkochia aurantiaca TaxID=2873700 RepID=UPI001CCBACE2|nr:hypothetical protein [Robertkochia sp. 3YJGBD-33]
MPRNHKRYLMGHRISEASFLLLVGFWLIFSAASAQGTIKFDNEAYREYRDSLQRMEYKHTFPVLGDKAYERGYDIPFPWGASFVFFTQRQEINIDRILLGVNGGEMADFSDFIVFGPTIATTYAYTFRPDLWVLPFLNLYAIVGGGTTQTEVNLLRPVGFQTSQELGAGSFGLGATLTGAVGPVWLAWDNNYNWADVEAVVEPIPAFNSSVRIGHNIASPVNPQRSLSVWAGVFYQSIQSDTRGSIPFKDIFPNAGSGQTIESLRNWAQTLPPPQRVIANQIINRLEQGVGGIDFENTSIDYFLDKEVAAPFNMIVGAQYQFNKHWMLRTELGVFGKRSQFLLNLNYRFQGLKKKY